MALKNEFVCTEVRFKFWNGKKTYTVEYAPGIGTWYVFDEETHDNCLANYPLAKGEKAVCTYAMAADFLTRYFLSIGSPNYVF